MQYFIEKIKPAIEIAKKYSKEHELLTCSVLESIRKMFDEINKSDIVKSKNLKVHYILYDIDSGKVSFID